MAAVEVLLKAEPAPNTVPVNTLGVKEHTIPINTGAYTSHGQPTAGFRTAKYTPEEWHQNNYSKFYQSFTDRDNAERIQHESKKLANETLALTNRTQADVTKKLGERIHDINFWKFELQREIDDLIAETELLFQQKVRLEKALDATEIPMQIATDNLECRFRRQGPDLVKDNTEIQLLREVDLLKSVQDLLKRTIDQTKNQIRMNRDAKQNLEMDWSDKLDAHNIDDKCGRLNNQSTDIQYYPNSAKFEDNSSTPETWAQFTHDNIVRAERERMASINLRSLIDNVLHDTSDDLREQCNSVNEAFAKRVEEMNDAKTKLENHLQKVLIEIGNQEKNIAMLKQAIFDKEAPMQVSQTRLNHRTYRPAVELCRDPVQYRLVSEVGEITESIENLKFRLAEAERSLHELEDTRMSLEKEIAIKSNSLFIDREKCMTIRTRYPTVIKLSGYQ
uniref:Tektin n=1 Tax=Phallusia mammillata TaxID=59560 RepID=A0A6F9DV94_9ASCI|nr:tektinA1 tektin A1 [Phallusia mammillata]